MTRRRRPDPRRSASLRRVEYQPRVDWLEARTLLDGDPFEWPIPVSMAPGLASDAPILVEPLSPEEPGVASDTGLEPDDPGFEELPSPVEPDEADDPAPDVPPGPPGIPEIQDEHEGNDTLAAAQPIAPVSRTTGTLSARDVDYFQITVTETGRLTAGVRADGVETRLSLLRADGALLIQSDGQAPGRPEDFIDHHLAGQPDGTTYLLKVEGLGATAGAYVLTTEFQPAIAPFRPLPVGDSPSALVSADFNGDGRPDLATANTIPGDVTVLLGLGDGTFREAARLPVGSFPSALVTVDVNGDGRPDLATANAYSDDVTVLLGFGDGTFVDSGINSNPSRSIPHVADFSGDSVPDVATTDAIGEILLRRGRPGSPGAFEPPMILRPDPDFTTSDLAVVATPSGIQLAALDTRRSLVALYARGTDGRLALRSGLPIPGALPVRIASADLNRDGRGDLAVATTAGAVFVFLQNASGGFGTPDYRIDLGEGLSDLAIEEIDGVSGLDLVVTNQASGDVSVLRNDPIRPFATVARFRAGIGLYGVEERSGDLTVRSQEGTAGVVAGDFDRDGFNDLIVTNSLARSFSVLLGTRTGGFLNPQPGLTFLTGGRPEVIVTGRFNGDPFLDVAVLNRDSHEVLIFLNDGTGRFFQTTPVSAGLSPSGLVVRDVNGDSRLDLMVGNEFGDVLTLFGNGDGTFQPYQRIGRNTALDVADLNGDGVEDYVFGNESLDRVSVTFGDTRNRFGPDRRDGLLAPGAVTSSDLNRDGNTDLIVANGGSNNVLVYLGLGGGQFAPGRSFFAGQNPAGLTVQDLDFDDDLDLAVANEGSNDVSILFTEGVRSAWTLELGPRVRVGGSGPVAVVPVPGVDGDGNQAIGLLVTNRTTNNVTSFNPRRDGFFNQGGSSTFGVGAGPQQAFVGLFDGNPGLDLVTINAASNDLSFLSDFLTSSGPEHRILTGGLTPLAGLVGRFNGDDFDDLIVANNDDGVISLLLGGLGGLSLTSTARRADLEHPTALALSALGIAVAEEGEEAVSLFDLAFDFGIAGLPSDDGPQPTDRAGFLPLRESSLAPVAELLTVRLGGTEATRTRFNGDDFDDLIIANNGDGDDFDDLIVANNGDGVVSLLLGGLRGLRA